MREAALCAPEDAGLQPAVLRRPGDLRPGQARRMPHPELGARASGRATIEAYPVVHGRGAPERGLAIGRLVDGRRFLSVVSGGCDVLEGLERREGVGIARVATPGDDGVNRFDVG